MHLKEEMIIPVHWQCEVIMKWLEMICCVDLPNLTSITSEGESFVFPRCVTLESIMKLSQYTKYRYSNG